MKKTLSLLLVLILILVGCGNTTTSLKLDDRGYAIETNEKYISRQEEDAVIKNVILLIGDGMGANQVEVSRRVLLKEKEIDLILEELDIRLKEFKEENGGLM